MDGVAGVSTPVDNKACPGEGIALLLIDVQEGLKEASWGKRNNPDAEQTIARLLAGWRAAHLPVIHVQHRSLEPDSPLRRDQPGFRFAAAAEPVAGEPVFEKTVNSAFIGTGLGMYLQEQGIGELVVAGLTTDHCVSTTVRMAGNLGFRVWLVADGTATFERMAPDGSRLTAEDMHRAHLESLDGEFCQVVDADTALELAELLPRDAVEASQ